MHERVRFLSDVERGELTVSEVRERYGISRKTGYEWLERNNEEGPEGWWTARGACMNLRTRPRGGWWRLSRS